MAEGELTKEQVLSRAIPWETCMTAKMISGTDLQLLRRYDRKPADVQSGLLDQDGPQYLKTFLTVLKNVSKEETIEYVMALIEDMLAGNPGRASIFFSPVLAQEDVFSPFLRLLQRRNWFILERSAKVLALLISYRPTGVAPVATENGATSKIPAAAAPPPQGVINGEFAVVPFLDWLCSQLKRPAHPTKAIPTATSALAMLLRQSSVRVSFVKDDGVKLLGPQLVPVGSQQQIQLLYETVLCVWLLSFYEPAKEAIRSAHLVPKLVEVSRTVTKEKVVRVAILALRNLYASAHVELIAIGFDKVVKSLQQQSWADDDLKQALADLEDSLKTDIKNMSSFDLYKKEVLSGSLDWTPMHKDLHFWRENFIKFEDNDFQALRVLVSLLEVSQDPKTLAVVCSDLGQFIQNHPAGRSIAIDLKAKDRVMKHMDHVDPEVKKHALLCIQKLLLGAKYTSFLGS